MVTASSSAAEFPICLVQHLKMIFMDCIWFIILRSSCDKSDTAGDGNNKTSFTKWITCVYVLLIWPRLNYAACNVLQISMHLTWELHLFDSYWPRLCYKITTSKTWCIYRYVDYPTLYKVVKNDLPQPANTLKSAYTLMH